MIEIEIIPPAGDIVVLDPIGVSGAIGSNGWTAVLSIASDGARRVLRIVDWAGGEDPKPAVGQYVGNGSTLVDDIADAVDIRGPQGAQGAQGDPGQILTSGGIFTGDGPPNNADHIDGDIYIDNLTADLYQKQTGVWVLQTNIKGAKGDKGDTGDAGTAGLAGSDGATVLIGSGVPSGGLGSVGDVYIDNATFTLYQKTGSSSWSSFGTFRGAAGNAIRVASGIPSNSLGIDGDSYVNSANGDLYARSTGTYTLVGNLKGPAGTTGAQGIQGPSGSSTLFGSGAPSSGLGANGDSYIDTVAYNLYTKSGGSWTNAGSLKGATGASGADGVGNAFFTGAGAPGTVSGSIAGDIYINTSNGDVYQKVGTSWGSPVLNIKGPQGDEGPAGSAGATGATGATGISLRSGSGAPSNALGNNGDSYVDVAAGNLYGPKASGTWPTPPLSLIGPQGNTGSAGATGAAGSNFLSGAGAPGSGVGANGDTYLNVSNGDLYGPKSAGAWGSTVGSLRGPTGTTGSTGAAGARGSVWYVGATTPPGAQSGQLDGDYYMVTGSGRVWKLVSGTWTDQGFNVAGPTGSTGATGAAGTLWYQGTSLPSIPPAREGDLFFHTSNYNVYQVIGSSWSVIANIKGPQGDAGTAGTNGTNGSNGDNGWTPVISIVTDSARRVMQIVDWVGGAGTKPSVTNQFVGASGIVSSAASAVDIRGPAGADGATGATGPSNLPMTSVSAARTIGSGDKGTCLFHPTADTSGRTWTIDNTSSWTNGDTVSFLNQSGAGAITIAISGTSAVLRQVGTTNTGSRTLAANGYAVAVRCPDSLTWYISGQGLT